MRQGAAYVRVSTADQSSADQLEQLLRAAAREGVEVPEDRRYIDAGVSGRKDSRPAFDRLREAIRSRAVDAVFVTKLDRIARSVRTALAFFLEAETAGVRVVVVDQAIDTGSPVGRLTRTVLAAVAEFEGELIRERTRSAMAAIKNGSRPTRSGRAPGRPQRVFEEEARTIVRLRSQIPPVPYSAIARRVRLPVGTCRRVASLAKRGLPPFKSPIVRNGSASGDALAAHKRSERNVGAEGP